MVADELRRQADQFIDIADLEKDICRDPSQRIPREARETRLAQFRAQRGEGVPSGAQHSHDDVDM